MADEYWDEAERVRRHVRVILEQLTAYGGERRSRDEAALRPASKDFPVEVEREENRATPAGDGERSA